MSQILVGAAVETDGFGWEGMKGRGRVEGRGGVGTRRSSGGARRGKGMQCKTQACLSLSCMWLIVAFHVIPSQRDMLNKWRAYIHQYSVCVCVCGRTSAVPYYAYLWTSTFSLFPCTKEYARRMCAEPAASRSSNKVNQGSSFVDLAQSKSQVTLGQHLNSYRCCLPLREQQPLPKAGLNRLRDV